MNNLKISTDAAVAAAAAIRTLNQDMQSEFEAVKNAVDRLDGVWDGQAAGKAVSGFKQFQAEYPAARYQVVENLANFLLQQVGQGYQNTEEVNTTIADDFM